MFLTLKVYIIVEAGGATVSWLLPAHFAAPESRVVNNAPSYSYFLSSATESGPGDLFANTIYCKTFLHQTPTS